MAPDNPCEGLRLYLAGKQVPATVTSLPGTAMPSVPKPKSSLAACDTKGQKGNGVTLKPAPQLLGLQHMFSALGRWLWAFPAEEGVGNKSVLLQVETMAVGRWPGILGAAG